MSVNREKLSALLKWYRQEIKDDLIAAIIVNREGLIMDTISGSGDKPEEVPPIPVILDKLGEEYPEHEEVFNAFKVQYDTSINAEEENNTIFSLGTWIKNHLEGVELNLGIVKFKFK